MYRLFVSCGHRRVDLHHFLIDWEKKVFMSFKIFVQPCDVSIMMFVAGLGPKHFQFHQFKNGMCHFNTLRRKCFEV